jgi:hypothetical protein
LTDDATGIAAQAARQSGILPGPHDIIYCGEWVGSGSTWVDAVREAERLIRDEMPWAYPIEWLRVDSGSRTHDWMSAARGEWLGYRLTPA